MNSKVICVFVVDDLYQGLSLLNKALNSNIICIIVGADRYPWLSLVIKLKAYNSFDFNFVAK